jgi:hypothetical protein
MNSKQHRTRPLRIGCASGFWGDTEAAAKQLVTSGQIDYLVFDFLAEITMSLLARARAKSADAGYAPDFVRIITALASDIQQQGIRVVANAGGVNPKACAKALKDGLQAIGIDLSIAVVDGDDLMPQANELRQIGVREMFTQEPLPEQLLSVNAYLGAQPIVAALNAGAQIVITGRVVDSAVTLGPLVHEFGWSWHDWNKLACGSLAGHIIECGTQATGGLYTDWRKVPGWDDMGFPIVECNANGEEFIVTKPAQTGGLVVPGCIAEQILYEIGDPCCYLLPDVCADFSQVKLRQAGEHRVHVSGVTGKAAPDNYKVSATYSDGWRVLGTLMIGGHEAAEKARHVGEMILNRSQRLMADQAMPAFTETSLEVLGAESTYGPHSRAGNSREVVLKIAAKHPQRQALELLAKEIAPSATSMAQGITGFAAGRPSPSPVVRLFSFLIPQDMLQPRVWVNGTDIGFQSACIDRGIATQPAPPQPLIKTSLLQIAHGRSGDKGNSANIGIVARSAEAYRFLSNALTSEKVKNYFSHLVEGEVRRYSLPGFHAFNFVMENALAGGGIASLRYDPQGKAYAQMLLDLELEVPASVLESVKLGE